MDPVRQASVAMFVQPGSMALVAVWLCQCSWHWCTDVAVTFSFLWLRLNVRVTLVNYTSVIKSVSLELWLYQSFWSRKFCFRYFRYQITLYLTDQIHAHAAPAKYFKTKDSLRKDRKWCAEGLTMSFAQDDNCNFMAFGNTFLTGLLNALPLLSLSHIFLSPLLSIFIHTAAHPVLVKRSLNPVLCVCAVIRLEMDGLFCSVSSLWFTHFI